MHTYNECVMFCNYMTEFVALTAGLDSCAVKPDNTSAASCRFMTETYKLCKGILQNC